MIVKWRNKNENLDDYFPRIESAMDSLGNAYPNALCLTGSIHIKCCLRVGDTLELTCLQQIQKERSWSIASQQAAGNSLVGGMDGENQYHLW